LDKVHSELTKALCLRYFPSPLVERQCFPEIEVNDVPAGIIPAVKVPRGQNEEVLVEASVNSARVSFKLKKADDLEHLLCHKFSRFLCQRAEHFSILRRQPLEVTFIWGVVFSS
jgi:actin related protein 2/3 complex subunit 4